MTIKISTIVDENVWGDFKELSKETHQNLSGMLNEAIQEYVRKKRLRPDFLKHMEDSLRENEALGRLLAK
jgi:hypothetical protein